MTTAAATATVGGTLAEALIGGVGTQIGVGTQTGALAQEGAVLGAATGIPGTAVRTSVDRTGKPALTTSPVARKDSAPPNQGASDRGTLKRTSNGFAPPSSRKRKGSGLI